MIEISTAVEVVEGKQIKYVVSISAIATGNRPLLLSSLRYRRMTSGKFAIITCRF